MLGYTENDVYTMMESVLIAADIIDGPADLEKGLVDTYQFLSGMLAEGRI